jgi:uncharacterized protein with ATP-grasp and redox domains
VTHDETALKTVLSKMMDVLKDAVYKGLDSFLVGLRMTEVIEEVTGCGDPYEDFKKRSTHIAQQLAPTVRDTVERSQEPLREACRASVMGNLMDVLAGNGPEAVDIRNLMQTPFAVDFVDEFASALQKARKVVFSGR